MEQRPLGGGKGFNHADIWEECSRQGNSNSKGPEVGVYQAYSRNCKKDRVAGMQPSKEKVVGGEVRKVTEAQIVLDLVPLQRRNILL